jgi:putative hydrolase of the HAD superfamily
MKTAAVLFDLYDTLVHATADDVFYHSVAAALGVSEARWVASYRALGSAAMLGDVPDMTARVFRACADAGEPRDPDLVAAVVREQQALFYAGIRPDPQALPALGALRMAGLKLAVVSNAASYSDRLLDIFGLRATLDAVIMSWSLGVLKPDPRIYRAALDALGTGPAEAVFVGDGRDQELRGARRLGLRTILVERGLPHTEAARPDADLCCQDLAEVARVLLP